MLSLVLLAVLCSAKAAFWRCEINSNRINKHFNVNLKGIGFVEKRVRTGINPIRFRTQRNRDGPGRVLALKFENTEKWLPFKKRTDGSKETQTFTDPGVIQTTITCKRDLNDGCLSGCLG